MSEDDDVSFAAAHPKLALVLSAVGSLVVGWVGVEFLRDGRIWQSGSEIGGRGDDYYITRGGSPVLFWIIVLVMFACAAMILGMTVFHAVAGSGWRERRTQGRRRR